MTARMRLTPRATKLSVRATIKSGSMNWTIGFLSPLWFASLALRVSLQQQQPEAQARKDRVAAVGRSPQEQDDAETRQQAAHDQQDRNVRQAQPGHSGFAEADNTAKAEQVPR